MANKTALASTAFYSLNTNPNFFFASDTGDINVVERIYVATVEQTVQ